MLVTVVTVSNCKYVYMSRCVHISTSVAKFKGKKKVGLCGDILYIGIQNSNIKHEKKNNFLHYNFQVLMMDLTGQCVSLKFFFWIYSNVDLDHLDVYYFIEVVNTTEVCRQRLFIFLEVILWLSNLSNIFRNGGFRGFGRKNILDYYHSLKLFIFS